jgi:hypothetical protein
VYKVKYVFINILFYILLNSFSLAKATLSAYFYNNYLFKFKVYLMLAPVFRVLYNIYSKFLISSRVLSELSVNYIIILIFKSVFTWF